MTPHQPGQLTLPELNYPYIAGLNKQESAMLKMWIVLIVDIALERMRE